MGGDGLRGGNRAQLLSRTSSATFGPVRLFSNELFDRRSIESITAFAAAAKHGRRKNRPKTLTPSKQQTYYRVSTESACGFVDRVDKRLVALLRPGNTHVSFSKRVTGLREKGLAGATGQLVVLMRSDPRSPLATPGGYFFAVWSSARPQCRREPDRKCGRLTRL
jgi:hypothetical protein